MGWHAPAGTATSLRELFQQYSSSVVARPVGAVPEHGRPVILKTAKRQPVHESDQVGNDAEPTWKAQR